MELLIKDNAEAVMPIVEYSTPPQRAMIIENNRIEYKWPENRLKRTQDLEKMYFDCGQFYCYKVKSYLENRGIIKKGFVPIVVDELQVQDIDNLIDWELAELKYKILQKKTIY